MRKLVCAMVAMFALGAFSSTLQADCSFGHSAAKKNDVETPPPAAETTKTQRQS